MSNEKMIHAPERTVERGRGCWNCTHYNNSELAQSHYKTRTRQERMAIDARQLPVLARIADDDASIHDLARKTGQLIQKGFTEREAQQIATADVQNQLGQIMAQARQTDARFQVFDKMAATGQIGICVSGHSPGDFVDHRYLCGKWDGKTGSSIATSGKPLDKLPDEMRDIVDSKAKKA